MSSSPLPIRVLLLGYYGFGNAGDEAVLAGLIQSIRSESLKNGIEIEIGVLSNNPNDTAKTYSVKAFHRFRVFEILKAISWCDLLAAGGGSLLQDVTSAHSVYYYLGLVRLAQILKKKTMFIAQGIGPLNNPKSRNYTAFVANKCDAITVRDSDSASLLRQIGVDNVDVGITADPALLLGKPSIQNTDQANTVLISLRPWKSDHDFLNIIVNAVKQTETAIDKFVPLACSSEDIPELTKVMAILNSTTISSEAIQSLTYDQILEVMKSAKFVIGMRLHSLILAMSCGVPCVALSYDPKVKAFMEQSGQGNQVFDIRSSDTTELQSIIEQVDKNNEQIRSTIKVNLPKLIKSADRNAQTLISLISQM
jgi:polysaccharide pyruvyl transferase CsaB